MYKKLYPDYRFRGVNDIPKDFFKEHKIKYVICDIDNTLVADNDPDPDEYSTDFINRMKNENIGICLVSNNSRQRVESFNREYNLPFIYRARKPMTYKIKRAMKSLGASKGNTAFIGDQLFTDMVGANRAGIMSILVDPINIGKENAFFKLKRFFENKVIER